MYKKSTTNRSKGELEDYIRPTCNKLMCVQPRRVDRRRRGQQAQSLTSFVDYLSRRNFLSPEFGTKFQKEGPLISRRIQISLQHGV